jgi:hypothetical protein
LTSRTGQLFARWYDADPHAAADQRVRGHVVIHSSDRQFGFRLPRERKIQIARKHLPSRFVAEFDDVTFGTGTDLHQAASIFRCGSRDCRESSYGCNGPDDLVALSRATARIVPGDRKELAGTLSIFVIAKYNFDSTED